MKTIIAGSRDITDYKVVEDAILEAAWKVTGIVSGGSKGVDRLGEIYAEKNSLPLFLFPANWEKHGKAAGPIRNKLMAIKAWAWLAISNGSKGTQNMINEANLLGLKVYVKWIK